MAYLSLLEEKGKVGYKTKRLVKRTYEFHQTLRDPS
jgi:hypothetical protein